MWSALSEPERVPPADAACFASLKQQTPAETWRCGDECCGSGAVPVMLLTSDRKGAAPQEKRFNRSDMQGVCWPSCRIKDSGIAAVKLIRAGGNFLEHLDEILFRNKLAHTDCVR